MNRLFKTLLLALLIPVCTYASGWNDEEYKRIEQSIQLPKLETTAKKYDISKFGAKVTNPAAQNQKAINRLIALVSKKGGGKVIIPKGHLGTLEYRNEKSCRAFSGRGSNPPLCIRYQALPIGSHLLGRTGMLELLTMHLRIQGYRHRHYR